MVEQKLASGHCSDFICFGVPIGTGVSAHGHCDDSCASLSPAKPDQPDRAGTLSFTVDGTRHEGLSGFLSGAPERALY